MGLARNRLGVGAKIAWVVTGYLLALVLAGLAVTAYEALFADPGRGNGGMEAFGDFLLFLTAFAFTSLPATAAALAWLRPCPTFWRIAGPAALLVAASGVVAAVNLYSLISPLRILLAPLLVLPWGLAGALAPNRAARWMLLGAAASEIATFAWSFARWLAPHG